LAKLPTPISPTLRAIYAAYEDSRDHHDGLGISVGEAGAECDRSLWYSFRWASQPEMIDGRKVSIFRTGDRWEEVLVDDLRAVGVDVWGQQDRIRLLSGHVRGKRDGACVGVLEAPKTEHLAEFKSSNDAGFKDIVKHKCRKTKPLHFAQCQLGMHAFGLTRCIYYVVNKNTDERYFERLEYDVEFCLRLLARLERIINSAEPPSRISDNPEFFGCRLCKHHAVCHTDAWSRVTCRSCLYSTPEMGGDGHWSCQRWSKPLGVDEQKAACPAHLTIPALVPGEQIDCSEEEEWVEYRMHDGSIWRDGAATNEATTA